jgi:type IV secretion system protein VirB9
MLKSLIYSFAIAGLTLVPALAEQNPVGFKSDVRIKKYVYDENNVYNLNLYLKSVTAIQFAPGEAVQSILIGDSASWEVVKLKSGNVVSIKPVIDGALTNMTVYTDQRVYTFQLRSVGVIRSGANNGAGQSFRTTFIYPENKAVVDKYKVVDGPLNDDYMVSGKSNFKPLSVSDNSFQTTFVLARGSQRPAVFKVGADGKERLINSRTDGDRLIVDGISDFWVMRIGKERICVGKAGAIRHSRKFWKG